MNTGQTLLSLGAFLLLGVIILRINSGIAMTDNVVLNTKFGVLGVSLASSLIEEANNKAFGQATDGNSVADSPLLTLANKLGPESGETFYTFKNKFLRGG